METTTINLIQCFHCQKDFEEIELNQYELNSGSEFICNHCIDEFVQCYDCNKWVLKEDAYNIEDINETVCNNCIENYSYCEICENYVQDIIRATSERGRDIYICDRCKDDDFFECCDCGEIHHNNNAYFYGDDAICERCRENYFYCEGCNELIHENEYGGDGLCNNCYSEEDNDSENNRLIQNYSYKPFANYQKIYNNEKEFIGIELEVEGLDNNICESINRNFLYFKNDGSLNDGAEIVTHPISFLWFRKHKKEFQNIFTTLRNNNCKSYNTSTCGIHIHYTRNILSSLEIVKICKFFYSNPGFILKVSQRAKNNLSQWASVYHINGNETIKYVKDSENGNSTRYTAVNLSNRKTIEFRIFRGTLNFKSFCKNIEFIKSVINFIKITGYSKADNLEMYFKYILKNKNEYRNLIEFLTQKGLI